MFPGWAGCYFNWPVAKPPPQMRWANQIARACLCFFLTFKESNTKNPERLGDGMFCFYLFRSRISTEKKVCLDKAMRPQRSTLNVDKTNKDRYGCSEISQHCVRANILPVCWIEILLFLTSLMLAMISWRTSSCVRSELRCPSGYFVCCEFIDLLHASFCILVTFHVCLLLSKGLWLE